MLKQKKELVKYSRKTVNRLECSQRRLTPSLNIFVFATDDSRAVVPPMECNEPSRN